MDVLQYAVIFLVGVTLLCLGANWLVRGAVSISEALGIPKHVVGLTVVALGTSAPELFVNLLAASRGEIDLSLANVSGSNLANVCVGFGLCSLVSTLIVRRSEFQVDLILVALAPAVVGMLFLTNPERSLPFWSVAVLSALLFYYLYTLRGRDAAEDEVEAAPQNVWLGVLFFVVGVASLYFGGEFVVSSAKNVATKFGVSPSIIGLTIVAGGTSVPDVLASVFAARKKEYGIAVGNILGSNISNLLLVLNGTVLISGQSLPTDFWVRLDYVAVVVTSGFACVVALSRNALPRVPSLGLLVFYFAYMAYRVWQAL